MAPPIHHHGLSRRHGHNHLLTKKHEIKHEKWYRTLTLSNSYQSQLVLMLAYAAGAGAACWASDALGMVDFDDEAVADLSVRLTQDSHGQLESLPGIAMKA